MSGTDIDLLKTALKTSTVVWMPDATTAERVECVIGVENEPSPCAVLFRGGYVALYNVELSEFVKCTPIKESTNGK